MDYNREVSLTKIAKGLPVLKIDNIFYSCKFFNTFSKNVFGLQPWGVFRHL